MNPWRESAPGAPIRDQGYEDLVTALCAAVAALDEDRSGATLHVPPVIDQRILRQGGYFTSFPDLVGGVVAFQGDDRDHARIITADEPYAQWSAHTAQVDVVLTPAVCYFVYPGCAGVLPDEGRDFAVVGRCYRHEPSSDPMRLRSFRIFERIRLGTPGQVREYVNRWRVVGAEFLASLLPSISTVSATDPFFGRLGRIKATQQQQQSPKAEFGWAGRNGPVALGSVNQHEGHFGEAFRITTPDGATAHSCCVGFGVDRIALAILQQYGTDPARWPERVRTVLRLWNPRPVDPDFLGPAGRVAG